MLLRFFEHRLCNTICVGLKITSKFVFPIEPRMVYCMVTIEYVHGSWIQIAWIGPEYMLHMKSSNIILMFTNLGSLNEVRGYASYHMIRATQKVKYLETCPEQPNVRKHSIWRLSWEYKLGNWEINWVCSIILYNIIGLMMVSFTVLNCSLAPC